MSESGNKAKISITVSGEVLNRVDKAAQALGFNRSQFIEQSMREFLDGRGAMAGVLASPALRNAYIEVFTRPEVLKAMVEVMGRDVPGDQLDPFYKTLKEYASGGEKSA